MVIGHTGDGTMLCLHCDATLIQQAETPGLNTFGITIPQQHHSGIMRHTAAVVALVLLVTTLAVGQTSKGSEFLGIKLGVPLAEQLPACTHPTFGSGTNTRCFDLASDGGTARVHDMDLPYLPDEQPYLTPVENALNQAQAGLAESQRELSISTSPDLERTRKKALFQADLKIARMQVTRPTDVMFVDDVVGYVGTSYNMDDFKATFAALKAKRGAPTACVRKPVQTLAGVKTTQMSCDWKMPWGYIYLSAPSTDNVTIFDVWAQTTRYATMQAKEKAAEHQQLQKQF